MSTSKKVFASIAAMTLMTGGVYAGLSMVTTGFDQNLACVEDCPSNTPVCGQDGFWYANSCLATCADTRIARSTLICKGAPGVTMNFSKPSSPSASAGEFSTESVSTEVPTALPNLSELTSRHSVKGYKFIGMLSDDESFNFESPNSLFTNESAPMDTESSSPRLFSSITKNFRFLGRYKEEEEESKKEQDSVPGAWVVIDEDGAAFVKLETPEEKARILQEAPLKNHFEGSANGCGSDYLGNSATAIHSADRAEESKPNPAEVSPPPSRSHLEEVHVEAGEVEGEDDDDEGRLRRLAVIGGDERWRIHSATRSPHKYIGQLTPIGCTGTLIGPSTIVTAGHCLWNRRRGGANNEGRWLPSDYFYLGRTDGQKYTDYTRVVRKVIHRNYRNLKLDEFDWDYGIAVLEKPLGAAHGWMGMSYDCNSRSTTARQTLTVSGYPADKTFHTLWQSTCSNIDMSCGWASALHECDTFGGMSGSAMFTPNTMGPGGAPSIKAIHVAGSSQINIATMVQPGLFQAVEEWRGSVSCPMKSASQN